MNFHNMDKRSIRIHRRHIAGGIVIGAALVLLFGYIVMGLWNSILPDLLSVRHINYWQSVGLLLLARILVGGFHGKGSPEHARTLCRWEPRERYERWWSEVGEKSYQDFVNGKTTPENGM